LQRLLRLPRLPLHMQLLLRLSTEEGGKLERSDEEKKY
jgi:hypothetical protein